MVDFYNGNTNIKKAGIKTGFTSDEIKEYIKCRDDILYFTKNYVKIITLDYGLQLFHPYEYQERMLDAFNNHRFVINLLPRQTGKSTIVAAYILHYAIFTPEKSIGILANKEATAIEILDRIKRMFENLPHFLQPGVKEYNKKNVKLGNDSNIMSFATGSDAVRGRSFNFVYLDEFAFVDNADEFFTSTYPVISSGKSTKVIITSTPNGMNLFYKIWSDAKKERNSFFPLEVKWNEHPDRDEEWREETINNIGLKKFNQEFKCQFHGSSDTLLDGNVLTSLVWEDPIFQDNNFSVYRNIDKTHNYIMTVDVSEGVGLDYTVINITDVSVNPYEQVAVWRSNQIEPVILPEILNNIAYKYNQAFVLIETNSVGSQVANLLYSEYEYENVIITKIDKSDNLVSGGFSNRIDYGLRMTKKTKNIGCTNIKSLIENNLYKVNDFNTIEELQSFSRKNNSFQAETGKHDDIVMTLVSFGWLSTQDYFSELTQNDTIKMLIEKRKEDIENELLPVGFYDDSIDSLEDRGYPTNFIS